MERNIKITYYLNGLIVQQIQGESTPIKMLQSVNLDEAFQDDTRMFDSIECHTMTKIGWQRRWILRVES